jgi:hypothetical protein
MPRLVKPNKLQSGSSPARKLVHGLPKPRRRRMEACYVCKGDVLSPVPRGSLSQLVLLMHQRITSKLHRPRAVSLSINQHRHLCSRIVLPNDAANRKSSTKTGPTQTTTIVGQKDEATPLSKRSTTSLKSFGLPETAAA